MAIAFRAAGASFGNASSLTITLPVPGGISDGDLLIAFVAFRNLIAITPPAGWTQVAVVQEDAATYDVTAGVYYRMASTEPADYTWTNASSGPNATGGTMIAYYGHDGATPQDQVATTNVGDSITGVASSINTVTADAWAVAYITGQNNISGWPDVGWTQRVLYTGVGSTLRHCVADKALAVAGASGDTDCTFAGIGNGWVGVQLAIRPASAAAGLPVIAWEHARIFGP